MLPRALSSFCGCSSGPKILCWILGSTLMNLIFSDLTLRPKDKIVNPDAIFFSSSVSPSKAFHRADPRCCFFITRREQYTRRVEQLVDRSLALQNVAWSKSCLLWLFLSFCDTMLHPENTMEGPCQCFHVES